MYELDLMCFVAVQTTKVPFGFSLNGLKIAFDWQPEQGQRL